MALVGDPPDSLAAVSLIRAAIADDADAGLLIMSEHGALADRGTSRFVMALASVAGRALLSSCGYNVERVVQLLDTWAQEYAHDGG
jgi:hypothetical protein